MTTALMLSIVLATLIVPAWAARARSSRRGLGAALMVMTVCEVLYLGVVTQLTPEVTQVEVDGSDR
jgi:hypothetical protein